MWEQVGWRACWRLRRALGFQVWRFSHISHKLVLPKAHFGSPCQHYVKYVVVSRGKDLQDLGKFVEALPLGLIYRHLWRVNNRMTVGVKLAARGLLFLFFLTNGVDIFKTKNREWCSYALNLFIGDAAVQNPYLGCIFCTLFNNYWMKYF